MDFNKFSDLEKLQDEYNEFVENASSEELIKLGENIRRVGWCMHSEAKMKEYECIDFEGKFLRIYGPFGDLKEYMYCTSNTLRCDNDIEDAELTLWGMYFNWSDSPYTDDAYANFDAGGTLEFRAKWVKEGLDAHNAGDKTNKNYIEVITEEEFIAAYEEFKKFINKDIKNWIDCMRTEPEHDWREKLIKE